MQNPIYGPSDDTWQTLDMLKHATDAVQDFHLAYLQKPCNLWDFSYTH